MPRPSKATLEAVKDAVAVLEARGEKPTLKTVRAVIGTGSYVTIAKHLATIGNNSITGSDAMYPMTPKLDAAIREYVQAECQLADKLEIELAKLREEHKECQARLMDLQRACELTERTRIQAEAEIKAAQERRDYDRKEIERLRAEIEDWKTKYFALEERTRVRN